MKFPYIVRKRKEKDQYVRIALRSAYRHVTSFVLRPAGCHDRVASRHRRACQPKEAASAGVSGKEGRGQRRRTRGAAGGWAGTVELLLRRASFLFLYFSKKNYRNIFLVLDFTVLYPYRPVGAVGIYM